MEALLLLSGCKRWPKQILCNFSLHISLVHSRGIFEGNQGARSKSNNLRFDKRT